MQRQSYTVTVLGILAILLSPACAKRKVKVDRVMRKIIDTTAAPQKVLLREQLDSICEIKQDSMVAAAVDSILKVRNFEVQKIAKDD